MGGARSEGHDGASQVDRLRKYRPSTCKEGIIERKGHGCEHRVTVGLL